MFDRGPYVFEKISGHGAADVQIIKFDPAGVNGTSFGGLYVEEREITMIISIKGATRQQMYENKQSLISILSPLLSEKGALGRFEYTNDVGTWWIPAAVKRGPQGLLRAGNYLKSEQIVFHCPNPFWRGTTYDRAQMAYLGGGMRFPLRLGQVRFGSRGYQTSIWSRGNSPSPLEVEIRGPAIQPEIVKVSSGEYIRLRQTKPLYEDDVLRIDTTPGLPSVTIQRAGGEIEDAIGYIDLTSTFFLLDPGENRLRYVSGDDSQTTQVYLATLPWFGGV